MEDPLNRYSASVTDLPLHGPSTRAGLAVQRHRQVVFQHSRRGADDTRRWPIHASTNSHTIRRPFPDTPSTLRSTG
jgi:hypothetical protein